MSETIQLGETVKYKNMPFRIVRVVKSISLLETESGVCSILDETYLELKGHNGEIDFLELTSEEKPYVGPSCPIKALAPLWKEKGSHATDETNRSESSS